MKSRCIAMSALVAFQLAAGTLEVSVSPSRDGAVLPVATAAKAVALPFPATGWDSLPAATSPFHLPGSMTAANPATSFRCAYDDQNLRVRFHLEEPRGTKGFPESTEQIWGNNTVELFLMPRPDTVYHLAASAAGQKAFFKGVVRDGKLDAEEALPTELFQSRVQLQGKSWELELTIPFASLAVAGPPPAGCAWRLQAGRASAVNSERFSVWSPGGRAFGMIPYFGILQWGGDFPLAAYEATAFPMPDGSFMLKLLVRNWTGKPLCRDVGALKAKTFAPGFNELYLPQPAAAAAVVSAGSQNLASFALPRKEKEVARMPGINAEAPKLDKGVAEFSMFTAPKEIGQKSPLPLSYRIPCDATALAGVAFTVRMKEVKSGKTWTSNGSRLPANAGELAVQTTELPAGSYEVELGSADGKWTFTCRTSIIEDVFAE